MPKPASECAAPPALSKKERWQAGRRFSAPSAATDSATTVHGIFPVSIFFAFVISAFCTGVHSFPQLNFAISLAKRKC
jgi:hypothetical protein